MKITFEDFLKKLESELVRLSDATNYRRETARISLHVAKKIKEVQPFLNQKSSMQVIELLHPDLDEERKLDVSKFLRVLANDLQLKATISTEVKNSVKQHMKNNKAKLIK